MLLSTPGNDRLAIDKRKAAAVMTTTRPHAGAGADDGAGEWRLVGGVEVPCELRAVREAREHVARLVSAAGLEWLLDDAELVASEIVTNALLHGSPAGRAVLLAVEVSAGAVRISVADYSDRRPVPRELPPDGAESGRGLHLIDSLAKAWGCSPPAAAPGGPDRPDGFRKVVWAEVA
jgi:anti-sigma regulatory factor (Ser/Thr protein kinase)